MKVEVLKTFGKQIAGSVIELNDNLAFPLIKKGIVKESKKPQKIEIEKVTEKNIKIK